MEYYDEAQFIAQVSQNDTIEGRIERWDAHRKNILHRGITLTIHLDDFILLQYRKHKVFDSVIDCTISTHQKYKNSELQTNEEAIFTALSRELNILPKNLINPPESLGKIFYDAKDPKSEFSEHEVCHIYKCTIDAFPNFNTNFAYDIIRVKPSELCESNKKIYSQLAPWVKTMLKKGLI